MRHLFEMEDLFNFGSKIEYNLTPEIKSELDDICWELRDDGFFVQLTMYEINKMFNPIDSLFDLDPGKYPSILIFRDTQDESKGITFLYSKVEDVIERIKDYMESEGYETHVSMNGYHTHYHGWRPIREYNPGDHIDMLNVIFKPKEELHESDQWATSNRIGGDHDYSDHDKIQEFIKKYNRLYSEFEDDSEDEDDEDDALFDDFLEDVESLLIHNDLYNKKDINTIINSSGIRDKVALVIILGYVD